MTIKDSDIDELLKLARIDKADAAARPWLRDAIEAIKPIMNAKKQARPQAARNKSLDGFAGTCRAALDAFAVLDDATKAALFLNGRATGQDLSARTVKSFLMGMGKVALATKQKAESGARAKAHTDEAVKLLVGFTVRFCDFKPSAKADSRFEHFSRRAFEIAIGEDCDLTRSIRRVLASRREVDGIEPRSRYSRHSTARP